MVRQATPSVDLRLPSIRQVVIPPHVLPPRRAQYNGCAP